MLKILYVVALLLVLSVPCAAEVTSVTCLEVHVDDGKKIEREIAWDDSQRDVIFVDGSRIPRPSADSEITLDRFGDALITWCYRDLLNNKAGFRNCREIDRTSGSFEKILEGPEKREVTARGTCRKSSEGKKF